MKKEQLQQIIKEEIQNVLNEDIGNILGYTAIAIVLAGNLYLMQNYKLKNFGINFDTNELNPLLKKVLNKVAPGWMRNREIKKIADKLSKIPEVMQLVNTPNKPGLRDLIIKYLTPEEQKYLHDLTRNTIKGAIQKEAAPSDFIKNKFPSVIDYDRDKRGSDIYWTLKSTEKLTRDNIADFQASAGYHPAGYGGPNRFNEEILPDGTFIYTWTCYASSD